MNIHTPHVRTVFATLLLIGVGLSLAAEAPKPASSKTLLTEGLAGLPDKEAVLLTVEFLPGGASLPHRHNADVFVYVLEGSLVMQVDGEQPVTVHAGETFHEKPTDIHRKSANASATEPAKFLVFIVKDKGKPITTPLPP
jgi:quercetin dioxygenase-like cupin family protein